jgi:nicotinamidase-related amidase
MRITYKNFETETSRGFPRYRSKRMDDVLARFRMYEASHSDIDKTELRKALKLWAVSDPKEYKSRDQKSGGLCTQLAKELDGNVQQDGANKNIISAHLLTLSVAGGGPVRAVARSAWQKCSIEDFMLKTWLEGNAATTCVIVIDMQGTLTGPLVNPGFAAAVKKKYNSDSVLSNQVSVVEAAAVYGMHVFEVRIETALNSKSHELGNEESRRFHNDPTVPELKEAFEKVHASQFVSIAKPFYNSFHKTILEAELNNRRIRLAIVMGFDGNVCVKNTIFGTPEADEYTKKDGKKKRDYLPGLLDRNISVLTSRVVLASSDGAPLDADYRMTG